FPIRPKVVQFLSVRPPCRTETACRGYLPLPAAVSFARSAGWCKRSDVDFISSRLVRFVGDPASVRGKLTAALIEVCLQEYPRFAISLHGRHPQITVAFRIDAMKQNEPTVTGPVIRNFVLRGFHQQRFVAGAAGRLDVEVARSFAVRVKQNATTVRRP